MILHLENTKTASASLLNLRHADVCRGDMGGVVIGKRGNAAGLLPGSRPIIG